MPVGCDIVVCGRCNLFAVMAGLAEQVVTGYLARAGITPGGDRPWDIQVRADRFWRRILRGSLGLGESYLDGDWDVESIDALFRRLIRADLETSVPAVLNRARLWILALIVNPQSRRRSRAVAEQHYDLDHRLYQHFLGPWNQYSCCFFNAARTQEEAEVEKLEMVCDKLDLKPDDHLLDIGSGWGGLARYAAETRGCRVTGINISQEQIAFARDFTAGLPVEILACDYRDLPARFGAGHFDKVVSIGMFEHVGNRNYRTFLEAVHHVLRDAGLFLLHTIGNNRATRATDPWIERYIFPNSMLPAMSQISTAMERLFSLQDWENYGHYYATTLAGWQRRFEKNWPAIRALDARKPFDERFRRMFNYYFLSCKAAFDTEFIHLWQIVMSKRGQWRSVYPRVDLRTGPSPTETA